jgi:hypothetical protein
MKLRVPRLLREEKPRVLRLSRFSSSKLPPMVVIVLLEIPRS